MYQLNDPMKKPLENPDPAFWNLPDFYTGRIQKLDVFEEAVNRLCAAQGQPLIEVTLATTIPAKRKLKKAESDPRELVPPHVLYSRRQVYGFATYSTGFSLQVPYKNQRFDTRVIPGHIWSSRFAGPARSNVMVIGKMPGRDEVNKLRNFTGPSGSFLFEQLRALGADPRQWYVTNLVKFSPPDNMSGAIPKPWINSCLPILDIEFAVVQPDYLLVLGSEAAKELLDVTVDRAYGSVFDYQYRLDPNDPSAVKTAKAIVAVHPAAVIRKADRLNQLQLSLRQFHDLTQGLEISTRETDLNHLVIRSEAELRALVRSIMASKPDMFSIDAEWYGRRPEEPGAFLRCYQFSWQHKQAAVVAITDHTGQKVFDGDPFGPVAEIFKSPDAPRLVGHNIKADLMWLHPCFLPHGVDLEKLAMPPEMGDDGPLATRYTGGFDTMLAAHGIKETGLYALDELGVQYLGIPRYDQQVADYLKKGVPHGRMPDEVLYPYGGLDACVTFRLAKLFNGIWRGPHPHDCVQEGYLDRDPQFGVNSRRHFWISMMAMESFMEMELRGILFDVKACGDLREAFLEARERTLKELQAALSWPDFNPNSINHKREMLFGEALNGKKPNPDGSPVRIRPEGAVSLGLTPLKATGKNAMAWSKIEQDNLTASYSPSTAKDTLGIFAHKNPIVKKLMDIAFITQALNTSLREASGSSEFGAYDASQVGPDDDQDLEQDQEGTEKKRGLLDFVCCDGAIRSIYAQTKETGRASSFNPNLMAISKRRDKDYKRVVGARFRPIRSLFIARPGYVLIEADFVGAELAVMSWLSGDEVMMDHVRRSGLPENDPDHFDIHSSFANEIFRLGLKPVKSVLEAAGKKAYRDAVKTLTFGIPYGRGIDAVIMAVKEESGIELTREDAESIKRSIFERYPKLEPFLNRTRDRVLHPGFLRDAFGGIRRFQVIREDNKSVEDARREAGNFRIQGTVARAMSMGLYYLRTYRKMVEPHLDYHIVNQIHDAAILECRADHAEYVAKVVMPRCLTEAIAFRPVDDEGQLVSNRLCKFDLDVHIYERWSQDLLHEDCDRLGISRSFGKAPKKVAT